MKRLIACWVAFGALGAALSASLLSVSCQPAGPLWGARYPACVAGYANCDGCANKAKVCVKPTVHALAHDLDELEEHIEKFGSVVAKQPDVWGQSRLTKHREDFEQQMAAELGNFTPTLQGSVFGSDQAYIADAFALSAAAVGSPRRVTVNTTNASGTAAPSTQQTQQQTQQQSATGLQPLPLPDQSSTFAAFNNITRTPVPTIPPLEFASAKTGITVEPTVYLDQKARYLNHLNELRRMNEGDDTADSPGYALDLVRIPVSVLPGKCTDVGYGAEVTMTMTPYLSDELLPTTFRNLILNDLVNQIGLPVTILINETDYRVYLDPRRKAAVDELIQFVENLTADDLTRPDLCKMDRLTQLRRNIALQDIFSRSEWEWVDISLAAAKASNTNIVASIVAAKLANISTNTLKEVECAILTALDGMQPPQEKAYQRVALCSPVDLRRLVPDWDERTPDQKIQKVWAILQISPDLLEKLNREQSAYAQAKEMANKSEAQCEAAAEVTAQCEKQLRSLTYNNHLSDHHAVVVQSVIQNMMPKAAGSQSPPSPLFITPTGLPTLIDKFKQHSIDLRNQYDMQQRKLQTAQASMNKQITLLTQRVNKTAGTRQALISGIQARAQALGVASESMRAAARNAFRHADASIPATKNRRARLPFPPSQMVDVYGYDFLYHITSDAFQAYASMKVSRPCTDSDFLWVHLSDVQSYLQEELAAAYKFLQDPPNADLWHFCTPELAAAIHTHQVDRIREMRQEFKSLIHMKTANGTVVHSTVAALAWATIVESALLTEQLVQDMREAAAAKGCGCVPGGWLPYFLPDPPPEARHAFNEYVRCRWPIHVFALDPVVEEQNIADRFSSRREMQLAMSLAFVSGNLSANNMLRYARRIEFDFATIDLNGTAVGFSHGDDTFGWRFYPRFQTPDIESNATVIFRDLLIGGPNRNALLRQRRLEPGMRECVAIVMMPSFVPYATLNVSSNWFNLTNPKCKELDSSQAMKLSRAVKSIENCAHNVCDSACYRDGDFERLLQKAKQLETRLPLQSTMVQIPYENTLGGFAMFNTGITDLAPELTGWYGSPSINPKQPTTLFLVGNHFSVHQTRVIAGGQAISNQEMLSRQVIKVVIPAGAIMLGDACQKFVDIHIATPYGVTQHLLVPVCNPPADAAKPAGLAWLTPTVALAYVYGGSGIIPPTNATDLKMSPPDAIIQPGDVDPTKFPVADITLKFDKPFDSITLPTFPNISYVTAKKGYVIPGDQFGVALFTVFGPKFGPEATNPPCALTVATTTLTFKPAATTPPAPGTPANTAPAAKTENNTTNKLTITWTRSPQCTTATCVK